MKNFYDFIRRTSGKLNEAAGDVYDWTKEEDIVFISTVAKDGNKYYQLRKLKSGKVTTSAIVDIGVLAAESGLYYVLTNSGSRYEFDIHNLDEDYGINGEPPIGSKLKLMWKEIKDVAKQRQQQPPEPAAPAANTPRAILGVSETATLEEIKLAYRRLARQFHPDRNPGDETAAAKFDKIQKAYNQLTGKEAQQHGTIEQGAPNQQQDEPNAEKYKEIFKGILAGGREEVLKLSMKQAEKKASDPNNYQKFNLKANQIDEFLGLISRSPSLKSQISANIDKIEDNIILQCGRMLDFAIRAKNHEAMIDFCALILIIALHPMLEEEKFDLGPQQQQGAPNQPQQQLTAEEYKELIKNTMRQKGIFELSMKKAIDEINNPTNLKIKNLSEDERKKFLEFLSTAPSYKSQIERFIDKMEDIVINYFGKLIMAEVNSQDTDGIASYCSGILMMALGQISEQQEKQKQQEDSQEHLLALARQLNNPKIRKGLVYMMNGNPGRLSVWAAEIKTPQDLQAKYDDWVRRGLIQ